MDAGVQDAVNDFIQLGTKNKEKKKPWIIFDVGKKNANDTKDTIKILQEGKPGETYDDLVKILLETDTAYALADYTLCEQGTCYLVFICWTKDSASIKKKMVASASVAPLRNLLSKACKVNLESHDLDDICCESMASHVKKCYKLCEH